MLLLFRQQLLPSLQHRQHMLPRPQLQTPLQPLQSPPLSTLHSLCGPQQVSLHLCPKVGQTRRTRKCSCDGILTLLVIMQVPRPALQVLPRVLRHRQLAKARWRSCSTEAAQGSAHVWSLPSSTATHVFSFRSSLQRSACSNITFRWPLGPLPQPTTDCFMYHTLRFHSPPTVAGARQSCLAHTPDQVF